MRGKSSSASSTIDLFRWETETEPLSAISGITTRSRASYESAPINDGIGGGGEFAVVRASKRIREMEIYGDEEYRAALEGSSQVV